MVAKMQKLGYAKARPEQMYGSAYIVSQYLKENYPDFKKVRVVGMDSIKKELEKVGISSVGGED
jgi:ribonucleotide monophosphatase NagD (HAD superfamily)